MIFRGTDNSFKIAAGIISLIVLTSTLKHDAPENERKQKKHHEVTEVTTESSETTSKKSTLPPDISKVHLVIKNEDACKMKDDDVPIQIAMFVVSHVGNLQRRKNIREAYPAEMIRPLGIRRVFVLASLDNDTEPNTRYHSVKQADIAKESRKFDDIVQFDSLESYDSLTIKSLLTFNYAAKVCNTSRFVFKMDDDLLLSYFKLLKEIISVDVKNEDNVYGSFWDNSEVIRNEESKYYVSKNEWSSDRYSQYVSGVLYGTSPATARALVKKSSEVNFFRMEDFYMTGLVADAVGVKRT